jgi:hypothetical protein
MDRRKFQETSACTYLRLSISFIFIILFGFISQ